MARALAESGDREGAASVLDQAAELVPAWAPLRYLIGETRAAAGDRPGAVRSFLRCLALEPSDRLGAGLCLALQAAAPVPHRLPAAYVEALFDDYAGRFDRSLLVGLSYRGPDMIAAALERLGTAGPGGGAMLDLGCGTGLVGERLRVRAAWLEGVDLSVGMLRKARAKGLYDALARADAETFLARTTRRFDLVVAGDVLNYLGALERLFRLVADVLTETGRVVATVEALDEAAAAPGVDLLLRETRRFAHDPAYVTRCAAAAGLSLQYARRSVLRHDRGAPVDGHVLAFGRSPEAAAPDRDIACRPLAGRGTAAPHA